MLLIIDMSKVFGSIHRAFIFVNPRSILLLGKLHMIKCMMDDVRLVVKIAIKIGDPLSTNIGTPQEDYISPW